MKMFGNNKTNLILPKDFENQNYTKHINIIYHHVGGLIKDRKFAIE